ncbi:phage portal protein, PBSX family [Andreprevotia lacus DSM 23236]|jgi:PBSX family phage portal protein|uniref:Phage portal protein, PBSX family n=1 Tax=Andreprevotia lacus DSM 23236 TaxID=1121001 RepID=A0A1W1XJL7_9NEIS|nr:phage portal protein [Andreprevotia lacus]SMC24155.1 phage portal protein, PBSX family [Andreprevotia lacus DSM 23236]
MERMTNYPLSQDEPPPVGAGGGLEMFTFGDPEAVLDRRGILDYLECMSNGRWYEPPLSLDGLAKSFRATPHHSSPIYVKRNVLVSSYIPHPLLPRGEFARAALDYIVFGNAYLERRRAVTGRTISMKCSLAKYTRRGVDLDRYFYVPNGRDEHEFERGEVFHLMEHDIDQEVYGLPEYLSALNSAWLNESATLFRRRYYKNGNHAGFILYMTDTVQNNDDIDNMRTALKNSKGPGNFRNLLVYAPGGKKDGIQLIPISEVAAKDEFLNIKNTTRDDQLAAHRVPPVLMGIIPTNTGGFGSPAAAADVFNRNEIAPLQARFMELNDWLGEEVIRFKPYALADTPTG